VLHWRLTAEAGAASRGPGYWKSEERAMMFQRLSLAIGLGLAASACQVPPNLTETTPPTVTVTLTDRLGNQGFKNNNRLVVPSSGFVDNLNPNMDILIAISAHDPGGMNTLTGEIELFANCPSGQGDGVFAPLTYINETAAHNPPNTVSDTLPFLFEVTSSMLKSAQAQNCPGPPPPNGLGTIVLYLGATNQANVSTGQIRDLLHMTGGVIPM
jgi:hypothetical protein